MTPLFTMRTAHTFRRSRPSRAAATLVALLCVTAAAGCIGIPASRPYVAWRETDHAAVGVSVYDSTAPNQFAEGAMVYGAIPVGDVDVVGTLQLDFSRGFGESAALGGGGSTALRYRLRLLDIFEVVPEISTGYLTLRTPGGVRDQAVLIMVDVALRFQFAPQIWAYVRPGGGAGGAIFGTSVGTVFPAVRLSYGAQWEAQRWLRLFVEGNVATEVGATSLAIGVLTVF